MNSRFLKNLGRLDVSPFGILLFLVLTHAGIQVGVLPLSLLQVRLTPAIAAFLIAVSFITAAAVTVSAAQHRPQPQSTSPSPPIWVLLLPVLAVIAYVILALRASTLPDYSWDGNTYHIPPINYWARAGHVHWVPVTPLQSELMNGYPKGAEVVTWLLTTLLRTPRFVSIANFTFLPLGVAGIASLCESLGTTRRTAWACGSLLVFVPVLLWQSVTSYVDCAFGCTAIAALAMLCHIQCEWGNEAGGWQCIAGLGCALGLLTAIKSSGILLAGTSLLALLAQSGTTPNRTSVWHRVAGVGAACAGVGGYWYVRNYLHTGSPLHPVGLSLAGHALFPGRKISEVLDFAANTPALFSRWPAPARVGYAWTQGGSRWPLTSYGWDGRLGGLGFLWPVGCLPSICSVAVHRLRRLRKAAANHHDRTLLLLAGCVAVAFLGTPLNWWARYTVWIYALGLPCLGVVLERILLQPPRLTVRHLWLVGVLLLALFEGALSLVQIVRNCGPGDPAFAQAPMPRERVGEGCALFPEAEGTRLQAILLSRDNVGLAPISGDTESGLLIGPLSLPLGARDLIPIPATATPDFAVLQRRNVRYLIYDGAAPHPRLPADRVRTIERTAGFWVATLR